MLLTITTTHQPANELGYLLHKHPERFQSFDMSFGKAHVYYSEVSAERCTACLLLDVDAVGMVRGKNADQNFLLAQYVNDRPYADSSFLSVAIAEVFGSALSGRCPERPELADCPAPAADQVAAGFAMSFERQPVINAMTHTGGYDGRCQIVVRRDAVVDPRQPGLDRKVGEPWAQQ